MLKIASEVDIERIERKKNLSVSQIRISNSYRDC